MLQRELEGISEALRIPGNKSLGPVAKVHAILLMLNTLLCQVVDSYVPHVNKVSFTTDASPVCRRSGKLRVCWETTSRPSLQTLLMTKRYFVI